MTLTEIRSSLAEAGIQLTRSLGQNFLHDANILRKIVARGELLPEDAVLEVGPGLGPLTELLAAGAGRVVAIEADRRLMPLLQSKFSALRHVEIVHADALQYFKTAANDWSDWKMISNLPYSVASPILVELALMAAGPKRIVATVQREVADRLRSREGEPAYGLLTLLVQVRYAPSNHFRIPRTSFFPSPSVDSTTLTLIRRRPELLPHTSMPAFVHLARLAFSQRRKMLYNRLRTRWPEFVLSQQFERLGLDRRVRAEEVSLAQFVALTTGLGLPEPLDAST